MKDVFITSNSCISGQDTFGHDTFLDKPRKSENGILQAQEPNYKNLIDLKWIRRMSRIVKMSVGAALDCLNKANIQLPEAIIAGTGLGCLTDTEKFLASIFENNEEMLSPTPFIQSTHNTVAGQLALILQSNNYNFTYVHKGFSFENALDDARLQLTEGKNNILIGGSDELTTTSIEIIKELNCHPGYPLGEGASFFLLGHKTNNYLARLAGFKTIYKPEDGIKIKSTVEQLLTESGIEKSEIDVLLLGSNQEPYQEKWYRKFLGTMENVPLICSFKNLSGEYHTASAFGLSIACRMLKEQKIFSGALIKGQLRGGISNILLYNHFGDLNHSIYLLSRN